MAVECGFAYFCLLDWKIGVDYHLFVLFEIRCGDQHNCVNVKALIELNNRCQHTTGSVELNFITS